MCYLISQTERLEVVSHVLAIMCYLISQTESLELEVVSYVLAIINISHIAWVPHNM